MLGCREGTLSRIFYWVLRHVDQNFCDVLQRWDVPWLDEQAFHLFAGAISAKGGVMPGCFGFIDGTARPIARPKRHQRHCNSGLKRQHCLKWQSIVTPNGLICNLYGGHKGSMHGSLLLRTSEPAERLQEKLSLFESKNFFIYGDSGSGLAPFVKKPFLRAKVIADQRKGDIYRAMSRVRESVE